MSDVIRPPEDDEERRQLERAVARGAGFTIAEFIERVIGQPPDEDFVNIVIARLEMASESSEPFELKQEIERLWNWRQQMC